MPTIVPSRFSHMSAFQVAQEQTRLTAQWATDDAADAARRAALLAQWAAEVEAATARSAAILGGAR